MFLYSIIHLNALNYTFHNELQFKHLHRTQYINTKTKQCIYFRECIRYYLNLYEARTHWNVIVTVGRQIKIVLNMSITLYLIHNCNAIHPSYIMQADLLERKM